MQPKAWWLVEFKFDFLFKARNYEYMGTLGLVIVKEGGVTTEGWCSYLIYPDWLLIPSKCIDLKRIDRSLQMNKNENHERLIFLIFTLNNIQNEPKTKARTSKIFILDSLTELIRITGFFLKCSPCRLAFHYCQFKIRTQSTWSVYVKSKKRMHWNSASKHTS